jgi:CBS domain-containing protein
MIVEQNAAFALIWNSERREFTGIVTLRNVLEMVTSLCESYDQWYRDQSHKLHSEQLARSISTSQKSFIEFFLIKISKNSEDLMSENNSSE